MYRYLKKKITIKNINSEVDAGYYAYTLIVKTLYSSAAFPQSINTFSDSNLDSNTYYVKKAVSLSESKFVPSLPDVLNVHDTSDPNILKYSPGSYEFHTMDFTLDVTSGKYLANSEGKKYVLVVDYKYTDYLTNSSLEGIAPETKELSQFSLSNNYVFFEFPQSQLNMPTNNLEINSIIGNTIIGNNTYHRESLSVTVTNNGDIAFVGSGAEDGGIYVSLWDITQDLSEVVDDSNNYSSAHCDDNGTITFADANGAAMIRSFKDSNGEMWYLKSLVYARSGLNFTGVKYSLNNRDEYNWTHDNTSTNYYDNYYSYHAGINSSNSKTFNFGIHGARSATPYNGAFVISENKFTSIDDNFVYDETWFKPHIYKYPPDLIELNSLIQIPEPDSSDISYISLPNGINQYTVFAFTVVTQEDSIAGVDIDNIEIFNGSDTKLKVFDNSVELRSTIPTRSYRFNSNEFLEKDASGNVFVHTGWESGLKMPVGEWYQGETRCIFIPLDYYDRYIEDSNELILKIQYKGKNRGQFKVHIIDTESVNMFAGDWLEFVRSDTISQDELDTIWDILGGDDISSDLPFPITRYETPTTVWEENFDSYKDSNMLELMGATLMDANGIRVEAYDANIDDYIISIPKYYALYYFKNFFFSNFNEGRVFGFQNPDASEGDDDPGLMMPIALQFNIIDVSDFALVRFKMTFAHHGKGNHDGFDENDSIKFQWRNGETEPADNTTNSSGWNTFLEFRGKMNRNDPSQLGYKKNNGPWFGMSFFTDPVLDNDVTLDVTFKRDIEVDIDLMGTPGKIYLRMIVEGNGDHNEDFAISDLQLFGLSSVDFLNFSGEMVMQLVTQTWVSLTQICRYTQ